MLREEYDLLGKRSLPAEAYWGIHTLRAIENFPISGRTVSDCPHLVRALAATKEALAIANGALGEITEEQARAIVRACQDVRAGLLHDQFPVDLLQGGAGTSTNMCANEVIANRALEHMGHPKGSYVHLHPNEHVNCGQSTNDVYPTALKIALISQVREFLPVLETLIGSFDKLAADYRNTIKIGRTQLQDAVPMTAGQEFGAYANTLRRELAALDALADELGEMNLGGTAIGTGIAAHPELGERACAKLAGITGFNIRLAEDRIAATQDMGAFVALSGGLRSLAVKLSKIANDLRLLASGPRAGLGDYSLPERQAGSSIMPGKVNPVMAEALNQTCFEVIGADLTTTMAAEAGQLQLNAFEPVIYLSLERSLRQLGRAVGLFDQFCIQGLQVNSAQLQNHAENSLSLATVFLPKIGYVKATELAKRARQEARTIGDLAIEQKLIDKDGIAHLIWKATGVNDQDERAAENRKSRKVAAP